MNLEEKQVSTKTYYTNPFLKVTEDEVILPDQKEAKRVVVHHPGGVNLIALDEENRLLLVEQYRYPVGKTTLETPAGKLSQEKKQSLQQDVNLRKKQAIPVIV